MLIQLIDILKSVADIVGAILTFLKPVVSPIGAWMVDWIEFTLQFFPSDSLSIYIALFIVLIVAGGIINSIWHGDEPPKFFEKVEYKEISDDEIKKLDDDLKAINLENEEIEDRFAEESKENHE